MNSIYLDNGATSYPKAPGVAESVSNYITNVGTNVGRGAYDLSYSAENVVFETRELVCKIFNFDKPENVVFTKNVTESLNVLIKGILEPGDHVIVSSMEHNAVMRPLSSLLDKVELTRVQCDEFGQLDAELLKDYIRPNTKAVIMTHASNVCGTIFDLERVGEICKEQGIFLIVDCAQTAGFLDIDFYKMNADAIGFTGHKSLLGPQGTGGFIIGDRMLKEMSTLIEGGTGSLSYEEIQPDYMPDKFEAGTLNIPGIYGLNTSLKYILDYGIENIRRKELQLLDYFLNSLNDIAQIRIIGLRGIEGRTAVVSVDFKEKDNGIIAHELSKKYGIMTRSGLHCAPSAHKTLGTFPEGTVRFSLSHFTTLEELDYTVKSIRELVG
ncbi:MAG: aminotransferase class V-fold PLP-dependent enzyme [Gudongella sp.]|jgi:cysteine desulfurase family protein|nr:aminotransferase class V-fold PLP-dependent enzyme [Gudongella sp.]